ncbi:unnamed protein product [Rangifer tarandus platyrhynchus]|uniref:Uncharacterized protein n=1 Tax=Rangifer tarandus platyrhynchus TaxID=3082113 RepID=A0AC59ZF67_RANTA
MRSRFPAVIRQNVKSSPASTSQAAPGVLRSQGRVGIHLDCALLSPGHLWNVGVSSKISFWGGSRSQ